MSHFFNKYKDDSPKGKTHFFDFRPLVHNPRFPCQNLLPVNDPTGLVRIRAGTAFIFSAKVLFMVIFIPVPMGAYSNIDKE